ncbi:hypothetical protein MSG28_003964 [Choristoneura fumiferana]|uniref:Uncharacterized protein n=1 Tax=Choristoneura fumiferana TaxID=7141 RepID=A0ACC0KHL8_CHOFU|nr:hypothetical protein MSG28_003964 [Choristoneura fumiferana]
MEIGYYYSEHILPQQVVADNYKPPQIVQDPDLSKRIAALEDWALNVDTRLKYFNQKLSKFDNLEQQIEEYSVKYLQQNLIHIFNMDANSDAVAAKLKSYFDKYYVSKEQMQQMSQEIHERLIASWKPEMDEDKIRGIVQEYLAVFEKKQMEVIVERIKEYVKEVEVRHERDGVKYPKTTDIGGVSYPVAYDMLELRVESNHGNPTYTCVYRFRVHGNPLNDIRMATEDSIRESET